VDENFFFISFLLHRVFFSYFITFFRGRQHSNTIDGLNIASYGLYFDGIDDIDDDKHVGDFDDVNEEHVGDFDAFSPGHSYISLFPSMVVDLADLLTRDGTPCAQSIFDVLYLIYSFTLSMSYHS